MAPKNATKSEKISKEVNSDEESSSVAPVKEKKKRVMTPEMLEVLRLARIKSLETKKALVDGGAEKRIEFYTEKVVKQQAKESVSKKGLKARAVAQLAGEILPELPVVAKKEAKIKPEVKPEIVDVSSKTSVPSAFAVEKSITIPESVLAKLIQNIAKLQAPPVVPVVPTVEKVAQVEKVKKKKVVKYVYEESTDSDGDDQIVVVKKKDNLPQKQLEQRAQNLLKPRVVNSYNIFGNRRL